MSIKQERIKQIMNMLIKESICNGELPTERNILNKFRAYIMKHDPSKPFFDSTMAVRGSDLVYSDVNTAFDNLYDDLSLLYRRCLALNRDLMANYILVDKQVSAVDNEIKKLEEEVKALIMLNNSSTYLNCAYDSFTDFSKINTSKTTADVDISKNQATISYNRNRTRRIATQPIITVLHPDYLKPLRSTNEGDLLNMFDDYENTVFSHRVEMSNNQGAIMEVVYDFEGRTVNTNKIAISFSTNKPVFARILYSPDNINVFDLPYGNDFIEIGSSSMEINFPNIQCTQIKFIFTKAESDSSYVSGGLTTYVYDFTINQIALFDLHHADEAVLISNPLEPVKSIEDFSIGKVSLQVDCDKPDQTDIEYYVALQPDENGEDPDWARISPINEERSLFPTFIDFMNRTTTSGIVAQMTKSLAEYELASLNTNGIKMYSIYNTDDSILKATLYKGLNASLIKTRATGPVAAIPDMHNFSEETVDYYNISNGSLIFQGMYNAPRIVQSSVNFVNKTSNNSLTLTPNIAGPSVIYLNGRVIMRGDQLVSTEAGNFNLRVGINNLTIMSYVPADTLYSANIGIDLISTFGEVFAHDTPMTLVDIFDLQNIVLSNDHSKYALYKMNNKTYIVVNDSNQAVKYKINYDYSSTDNNKQLLFKAVLKRQPYANTTPVLYRYVIYCE